MNESELDDVDDHEGLGCTHTHLVEPALLLGLEVEAVAVQPGTRRRRGLVAHLSRSHSIHVISRLIWSGVTV